MPLTSLRKKYPKWAHRRDYHKKKRRRSRRRRRRRRRVRTTTTTTKTVSNGLLMSLLQQLMGSQQPVSGVSRKHGSNVLEGYGGSVRPDRLAPLRSRDEYVEETRLAAARERPAGVGPAGVGVAGAAAAN